MKSKIYIGTSGWHYTHWIGSFYPKDIKGYNELKFHSEQFNTVENNSSFYRIAGESTYKTWMRMTKENPEYKFSMKLNKLITHNYRLELTPEVKERVKYILNTTQALGDKLGAIVIQLPASFKVDLKKLDAFLKFFKKEIAAQEYRFDVAIEFRKKDWFTKDVFALLKKHNVALVAAQSSRYPGVREVTADVAYIRLHGPKELFASSYSNAELKEWATYIKKIAKQTKRIYIYFNNDFGGYAIENAQELMRLLKIK